MGFKQLAYFIAIAESNGISAAAAQIHIAQPALSAQLAKLEEELGVTLFVRHNRGVNLTQAGEVFLKHAYKVLDAVDTARRSVIDVLGDPSGQVTIGLPVTTSTIMTVPIVELAKERFPGIKLCIVDGMSGDIYNWLIDGTLDLAVLYGDESTPATPVKPIVNDELYLIGHHNQLTLGRKEIEFRELANFPLLHNSFIRSRLRQLLEETAAKLDCQLNFSGEIDSVPQLKELVFRGQGFTVLPKISLTVDQSSKDLCMLRIKNPDLFLVSYLALSPKRSPSHGALCIYELVNDLAKSLIATQVWAGGHSIAEDEIEQL